MPATVEKVNTLEDLQENPPPYAKETAALLRWSVNYEQPTPAALFLDIIGYSDLHFGDSLYGPVGDDSRWGYMEIDMLADALKEYAERPQDVMRYVEEYLEAESQE